MITYLYLLANHKQQIGIYEKWGLNSDSKMSTYSNDILYIQ